MAPETVGIEVGFAVGMRSEFELKAACWLASDSEHAVGTLEPLAVRLAAGT
jgi:hypothetical protein